MSAGNSHPSKTIVAWLCLAGLCLTAFFAGAYNRASTGQQHQASSSASAEQASKEETAAARKSAAENQAVRDIAKRSPQEALLHASSTDIEMNEASLLAITTEWLEQAPDEPLRFLFENSSLNKTIRQQLYMALLPVIVREAPEDGFALAEQLSQPYRCKKMLVEEWALAAPEDTLAFLSQIHNRRERERLLSDAYKSWLDQDTEQAVGWLLSIEDRTLQHHLLDRINWHPIKTDIVVRLFRESHFPGEVAWPMAERLGRHNIGQLIDTLNEAPWDGYISNAYSRIPIKDQSTFLTALDAIRPEHRNQAVLRLFNTWLKQEPTLAWKWAQQQRGTEYYQDVLKRYSRSAPLTKEQLQFILSQVDAPGQVVTSMLRQNLRDHSDPIQWAKDNLSAELREQAFLDSFDEFLRRRPSSEILPLLHELPEGEKKDAIFKKHLDVMMLHAPEETLKMIRSQGAGRLRETQSAEALENWIWADPDAAKAYIAGVDWIDADINSKVQLTLARQLSKTDKAGAIRLLKNLPEQNGRNDALGEFLEELTVRGEGQLVRNTIDRLPNGPVKDSTRLKVLDEFAAIDPRMAYQWIQYEQDESFQARAYQTISSQWAKADSNQAEQWARSLSPGSGRDHAVKVIVGFKTNNEDFKSAFDLALSIQQDQLRKSELSQVLRKWTQGDPFDASRSVNYSNRLSEEEKELLLRQIK